MLLAKVSPDNTILRVSFVCHVDYSDDKNNSDGSSYTYGDFVIIGRGKANPIKFIDVNIKDYEGKPKVLSVQNDTILEWENRNKEHFKIILDQENGTLSVENELFTLSYMFELFGGM